MANASEVKRGMAVIFRDELYLVKEAKLLTPGNWRSMIQAQLKSIKTGKVINNRFRPDEQVEIAYLTNRDMQYLYKDGTMLVFMDSETYEQISINEELVGDQQKYLADNLECKVGFHGTDVISVTLPTQVVGEITFAPPGEKGDTATNTLKPAETNLGFEVQVPLFIKSGDRIKISTETGGYMGKSN